MKEQDQADKVFQEYQQKPLVLYEGDEAVNVVVQYSKSQEIRSPRNNSHQAMSPRVRAKSVAENRILLITVQDPQYPITTNVLHKVFAPFGKVEKIVIFLKTVGLQVCVLVGA